MTIRRTASLLALLPALALAQPVPCPTGDYAQYKDKAAADLPALARDWCGASVLSDFNVRQNSTRAVVGCASEQAKMRDAAAAAGKADEFAQLANVEACRALIAKGMRK